MFKFLRFKKEEFFTKSASAYVLMFRLGNKSYINLSFYRTGTLPLGGKFLWWLWRELLRIQFLIGFFSKQRLVLLFCLWLCTQCRKFLLRSFQFYGSFPFWHYVVEEEIFILFVWTVLQLLYMHFNFFGQIQCLWAGQECCSNLLISIFRNAVHIALILKSRTKIR